MTRTTPRRLMTLQPIHIFFTDALTFKVTLLILKVTGSKLQVPG
jgi:hypothetical protein